MQLKANIGFINLENIDDFFPEELIDHKEIERIDKEERRKRRMLENAEQSIDRRYRELQYILLAEYEDKKLERQDTDTSLVHNSIIEETKNNNANIDNNDEDNNFIFSNNLKLLPKIKTKENMRYINNKKEEENRMKNTVRNFNVNTISAKKIKNRSSSKIFINAKNTKKIINMSTSKMQNNNYERKNLNSISTRVKDIRPMNLRDRLIINAKNKVK